MGEGRGEEEIQFTVGGGRPLVMGRGVSVCADIASSSKFSMNAYRAALRRDALRQTSRDFLSPPTSDKDQALSRYSHSLLKLLFFLYYLLTSL